MPVAATAAVILAVAVPTNLNNLFCHDISLKKDDAIMTSSFFVKGNMCVSCGFSSFYVPDHTLIGLGFRLNL